MHILVISNKGGYSGLAHRIALEGHSVSLFVQAPGWRVAGEGVLRNIDSWRTDFLSADLIVCDENLPLSIVKTLDDRGVPRLNSSADLQEVLYDPIQRSFFHSLINPDLIQYEEGMREISVMGYWNGVKWLQPFFVLFRETRPFHRYFSVAIPEAVGVVSEPVMIGTRLFYGSLARITDAIKTTNYKGSVQLNGYVHGEALVWNEIKAPAEGLAGQE